MDKLLMVQFWNFLCDNFLMHLTPDGSFWIYIANIVTVAIFLWVSLLLHFY